MSLSKPLERLMNAEMIEKQKGFAVLQGVKEATFARFIEWVYKSTYTAPHPVDIGTEEIMKDLTKVFLAHAELYVFAEEKDVQDLKAKALENLWATYKTIRSDNKIWISEPLQLPVYIYQNTSKANSEKLEPLREFAIAYLKSFDLKRVFNNLGSLPSLGTTAPDLLRDILFEAMVKAPKGPKEI